MLPSLLSVLACENPILYYTGEEISQVVPRLPLQPIPIRPSIANWANKKVVVLDPKTTEGEARGFVEDDSTEIADRIKATGRHVPITTFPYRPSARPIRNPKFETHVQKILKDSYASNPRPSKEEKQELADKTKKTWVQINNWFSNRRRRYGEKITQIVWTLPNE
ncbi:MAG: homeobox domain-containing protein [Parachlamydia sp.]|nr:homeobox domain-containing protein [Parachlamydia sp.]